MLGLYLAVASAGARERLELQPVEAIEDDPQAGGLIRRYIAQRAVVLLGSPVSFVDYMVRRERRGVGRKGVRRRMMLVVMAVVLM